MRRILALLILVTSIFSACKKDEPVETLTTEQNANIENNRWIYNNMKHDYLFYKDMPTLSSLDLKQDPEKFFSLLLSPQEKRSGYSFSYIKKNTTTKSTAESDATLSYGMEYMSYNFNNGGLYAIRVLYVTPNSAAARSGIKRGDWFSGVGGVAFGPDNIGTLLSGNAISLDKFIFTRIAGELQFAKMGSVDLQAATIISENPIFLDTVYTMANGDKVGYFVYNKFTTGPNGFDDKTYDNQMKQVFARFKAKGVQELILDLRYNGGGYLSSCQLLSSMILPTANLGDVMAYEEFNDVITAERVAAQRSPQGVISFLASNQDTPSLDLRELYVICGRWTASSSELVINVLKPFMTVKLIGSNTVGKNIGSYEIKNKTYTLHPITTKIYNNKHESNYEKGFSPDYFIDEAQDDLTTLKPLGDIQEVMINNALVVMGYVFTPRSERLKSAITASSAMDSYIVTGSSLSRKGTDLIMNR